jgi:hypothetical protein
VTFQKREVLLFIVAFRKVYLNIRQWEKHKFYTV